MGRGGGGGALRGGIGSIGDPGDPMARARRAGTQKLTAREKPGNQPVHCPGNLPIRASLDDRPSAPPLPRFQSEAGTFAVAEKGFPHRGN